jgi:hypothetical protein
VTDATNLFQTELYISASFILAKSGKIFAMTEKGFTLFVASASLAHIKNENHHHTPASQATPPLRARDNPLCG